VAFELAERRVSTTFDVLVDAVDRQAGVAIARHEGQATGVDSVTKVEGCDAEPGSFLTVRGIRRDGYDLIARPVNVALPVVGA